MFAKRPLPAGGAPASNPGFDRVRGALAAAPRLREWFGKPTVGVAGAGILLLAAVVALVAVTGDPWAGAPRVKIPLGHKASLDWANGAGGAGQGAGPSAGAAPGGAAAPGAVQPLPQAPIAGLSEPGPSGLLPVIAADGRTPFQAYARPFKDSGAPKVALVIGGLGLNAKSTRQAIEELPPEVTLSFVPYTEGLQGWIDLARANGHEVLLETPMEPLDYPANDPGPFTLMAQDPAPETLKRLEWLLSRATGYLGVTNYLGGRFMASDPAMNIFSAALRQRGLGFIDDGSAGVRGGGMPRASADRIVDQSLDGAAIDQELATLESTAQQHGRALGSGFAYPVTLQEVKRWAAGLNSRGLVLAPASAMAAKR